MSVGELDRDKAKRAKLEAAGFTLTDTKDWIGLTIDENMIVEMRVALAAEVEKVRKEKGITQVQLAKRMGTRQSGVARMINNPDSSSIDNLMKALIAMGTPISRIAASLLLCTAAGN